MIPHLLATCINHFSDITMELFLFVVAFRWFTAPADRKRTELLFLAGFAGFIAEGVNVNGIRWLGHLLPYRYDLFVYNLDVTIFHVPGFVIGRFLDQHMWTKMFIVAVYNDVTVFMLIAFVSYLYLRDTDEAKEMFMAFVLNPVLAICLYAVFPVSGPIYVFGSQFPYTVPAVGIPHMLRLDAVPNGVPSVHISIALLVLWFLRRWWWGQITGAVFLIATVVATLGLGEHYVFDVLCAVPYAALVLWLTQAPAPAIVSNPVTWRETEAFPALGKQV